MTSYLTTAKLHPNFSTKFLTYSKLLAELGATLSTPSGDGYIWRVTKGARSLVFLSGSLPINLSPAANIARDKLATCQILAEQNIDVPKGFAFFADIHGGKQTFMDSSLLVPNLASILSEQFDQGDIDRGLIVKPGTESAGLGVQLCFGTKDIVNHAAKTLVHSHYGLVQEFINGQEFRVAILDDEILVTYRKRNPVIEGDGSSSLGQLLERFYSGLKEQSQANLNCEKLLQLAELSYSSADQIIPEGEQIELQLEVRNLSHGAWPELVEHPPAEVLHTALRAHRAVGLSFSGVDIKLRKQPETPSVIEVNGNPGFTFLERFHPKVADGIQRKIARRIIKALDETAA